MGLIGTHRRGGRHSASSTRTLTRGHAGESCAVGAPGRLETRHETPMCTPRSIPVDPYAAWLAKREAEQEAQRARVLCADNPRAAWERLKGWEPPPDSGTYALIGR